MRFFLKLSIFLLLLLSSTSLLQAGPLSFSQYNIILLPRDRVGSILVHNPSNKTQRFRISFIDKVMDKNGNIAASSKKTDPQLLKYSATRWLLPTPRSITLPPKQSQVIRVLARRPKNLTAGVYRSQLYFKEEPAADSQDGLGSEQKKKRGIQLSVLYNTSLPVFIHQGSVESTASIKNLKRSNQGKTIGFQLERTGNDGFYGIMRITSSNGQTLPLPLSIYREQHLITQSRSPEELETLTLPWTIALYKGREIVEDQQPIQVLTLTN